MGTNAVSFPPLRTRFFVHTVPIAMPEPTRLVFHVDMDAFFVSVEELYDGSLRGRAVVVGGQRDQRGVVAAASYEARKFGVHSAMPLRTAAKLCPQAVFLDGHPERYRECSERVLVVLHSFSPKVEMASIDEAYLDMTGSERLLGPPLKAAHALHTRMKEQTRLNCSVGVGTSRLVAKVASEQAKPNGVLYVLPGMEAEFLGPLEVRKLPGVGKVTERELHAQGIYKVRDLAARAPEWLEENFGAWGTALHGKAQGLDAGGWFEGEIGEDEDAKSISHEHTYERDTADAERLESTLARLTEMVCRRLREHGFRARTVQLKLRYTDFKTITRARTLPAATDLDGEVFQAARELFRKNWRCGSAVRLLGVETSHFVSTAQPPQQMDLLGEDAKHERWSRALGTADKLRDRFGDSAVVLASGMGSRFREKTHENPAGLPGKKPKAHSGDTETE
jgi:DNA polymerase IV